MKRGLERKPKRATIMKVTCCPYASFMLLKTVKRTKQWKLRVGAWRGGGGAAVTRSIAVGQDGKPESKMNGWGTQG